VAVDALPQATDVEDLARHKPDDAKFKQLQDDLANADSDLGATPTLYDRPENHR
jgi:hypothetical protein